ncbi:MAG TPA: hypothetical protein VF245_12635 [Solirubrobacterales bacterium]
MTTSSLPKRILTVGMPSDYPPEFREISAACDFAISVAPDGQIAVTKDRTGVVPRPPSFQELLSCTPVFPKDVAEILGGGTPAEEQRPAPRFEQGDRVTPGPDSTFEALRGQVGVVAEAAFCQGCQSYHYRVGFEGGQAQMLEDNMRPADQDGSADYAPRDEAPAPDGWQGTEPAEGTRRFLIREALLKTMQASEDGVTPLQLADAVESTLLNFTIEDEADEGFEDVSDVGDFPAFEVIDDEGVLYVSLRSIIGIFEHLRSGLIDAEIEEEQTEKEQDSGSPRFGTMVGGRRGGRRQAMIEALREDAASDEDAEAAVSELERTGRAFLDSDGRHAPPASGFRVEGSQLSPLARFLDFLGVR